jgi:hypothetical protein
MRTAACCLGLLVVIMLGGASVTHAQDDDVSCPVFVNMALATLEDTCSSTGRNEVCYGHDQIDAALREEPSAFDEPADTVSVTVIERLQTGPLDPALELWGLALMRIQADLPDSLPGQNVTFLLLGDVEIIDAGQAESAPEPCEVAAAAKANLRGGPGTDFAIVGSVSAGEALTVTGQNAAGDWLQLATESGAAWLFLPLTTSATCDFAAVPLVEPGTGSGGVSAFGPMQAFTFRTGPGGITCAEAPPDSLVIRAPDDVTVHLRANGVDIALGSIVSLTARPGDHMTISLLEGTAIVTAAGVTQAVLPGFHVQIPMDSDLNPTGPPAFPEPFDAAPLAPLVSIPPAVLEAAAPLPVPQAGTLTHWEVTSTIQGDFQFTDMDLRIMEFVDPMLIAGDGQSLYFRMGVLRRTGPQTFGGTAEWTSYAGEHVTSVYELTFTSDTTFTMEWSSTTGGEVSRFTDEGVLVDEARD